MFQYCVFPSKLSSVSMFCFSWFGLSNYDIVLSMSCWKWTLLFQYLMSFADLTTLLCNMVFMSDFNILKVNVSPVFFAKPTKYPGTSFVSGNAILGSRYNTGSKNWNTKICEISGVSPLDTCIGVCHLSCRWDVTMYMSTRYCCARNQRLAGAPQQSSSTCAWAFRNLTLFNSAGFCQGECLSVYLFITQFWQCICNTVGFCWLLALSLCNVWGIPQSCIESA